MLFIHAIYKSLVLFSKFTIFSVKIYIKIKQKQLMNNQVQIKGI
jgi:hypothetical protein